MNTYVEKNMAAVGEVYTWDVINEAVGNNDQPDIKENPWKAVDDFSCKLFKKARIERAKISCSKMKLAYNDYNFEIESGWHKKKSDRVFAYVKDLKDRDCGIDAIGF